MRPGPACFAGLGARVDSKPDRGTPARPAVTALLVALLLATSLDTLVVGDLADPVSLDPPRATDFVSASIVANVCDTLVRWKRDGSRPEAALATTWATADNRVWTFTLREGVRFHDGVAFDADAVVANFDELRRLGRFRGVAERVGPHIVTITLEAPNSALLATLSQAFLSLQSPLALRRRPATAIPIGTGAFSFAAGKAGELMLAANPDYWGGAPRLRQLVFRRFASETALVAALESGDVDVTSAVAQDRVQALRQTASVSLDSTTGLNIAFLSINNERAPFSDVRVRQAVARAVDRAALVQGALGGHGVVARNPLPPLLFGYNPHSKELVLDRPTARKLLAEAGFPHGFPTTLLAVGSPRPYLPAPLRLAEQIRQDLGSVGIDAKIRELPSWSEYVSRASAGDYDIALMGWQADTADPNDFLEALLSADSIGSTNRSRYRSPAMDGLLKRGRTARHAEERRQIYHEAQELFQRDMPWVPLYHVSVFTAFRRAVHGFVTSSTGILRYDKTWKTE
jgi:peptide/nickel transport system substrate-binding protein